MKKIMSRLRDRRGFTLAETLMAILILLMVSAVVATGIPVAANALSKAVDASHAQALLSTTMTALRDELSTAKGITVSDGKTVVTYTDGSGIYSRISLKDGRIMVTKAKSVLAEDAVLTTGDSGNAYELTLVSDQAATNMLASYSTIEYDEHTGIVKVTGLQVKKDGRTLATMGDDFVYEIRVVSIVG